MASDSVTSRLESKKNVGWDCFLPGAAERPVDRVVSVVGEHFRTKEVADDFTREMALSEAMWWQAGRQWERAAEAVWGDGNARALLELLADYQLKNVAFEVIRAISIQMRKNLSRNHEIDLGCDSRDIYWQKFEENLTRIASRPVPAAAPRTTNPGHNLARPAHGRPSHASSTSQASWTSTSSRDICFRCGFAGHPSHACVATATVAGKVPWAKGPSGKGLQSRAGKAMCFGSAKNGNCSNDNCDYAHECTLCAGDHAASRCTSLKGRSADPRSVVTPLLAEPLQGPLATHNLLDAHGSVVESIRLGFDVEVGDEVPQHVIHPNHRSATNNAEFVSTYIATERAAGRLSRAFSIPELLSIIGPFRTSPLGTVPKPGSDKLRMIQDLSHPKVGGGVPSVNSFIASDDFPTEWSSFAVAAQMVVDLPAGCIAATFDVDAAYRIIPVRPLQQNWFCVEWLGAVYVDAALCFGCASSAGVFGQVPDCIADLARAQGFRRVLEWVDDFMVIRLPGQTWTEADFTDASAAFGILSKRSKTRPFSSVQRFIGLDWDLERRVVSVPDDKLAAIQELLAAWACGATVSLTETQSLCGKLVYIASVFTLIKPFMSGLRRLQYTSSHPWGPLRVHRPLSQDISRIRFLLDNCDNTLQLRAGGAIDIGWWGDASTSWGAASCVNGVWDAWQWTSDWRTSGVWQGGDRDIGWAEAVAVDLGLLLLIASGYLTRHNGVAPVLSTPICMRSDNASVVSILTTGRACNPHTDKVLRSITDILVTTGARLAPQHVPGVGNIADGISRGTFSSFVSHHGHSYKRMPVNPPSYLRQTRTTVGKRATSDDDAVATKPRSDWKVLEEHGGSA